MSENNVDQQVQPVHTAQQVQPAETVQQAQEAQPAAAAPKKRVRVGFIFLSIVPVAALIGIQSVTQIPFLIKAIFDLNSGAASGDPFAVGEELLEIFNTRYAVYAYLLYAVIGLIVFGLWYYLGFVKKNPKVRIKEVFGVKSILAVIGVVIGLQFLINAAFVIAFWVFPDTMNNYVELMKASGLMDNPLITVLYGILLGPVLEELCLRGVCFGFLEKSNIKPFFIILISGILFGIMHMNLVQGIYASVLGFFLGFLRYKYRSLKITVAAHILFNLMGTYGDQLIGELNLPKGGTLILGGLSLFVLVFTVILVNGDNKARKESA